MDYSGFLLSCECDNFNKEHLFFQIIEIMFLDNHNAMPNSKAVSQIMSIIDRKVINTNC